MAEPGARRPASTATALENEDMIVGDTSDPISHKLTRDQLKAVTDNLRGELSLKIGPGFKKGGKVGAKGGVVHPGEYVIAQPAAAKLGTKTLNRLNHGATDGLGIGQGGLAIHPSLRSHNIAGREPRHTSKLR